MKIIMEMTEQEYKDLMRERSDAQKAREWENKYYKVADKLNALADEVINDETAYAKEDARAWIEHGLNA